MARPRVIGPAERTTLQILVGVLGAFAAATGLNAIVRGPSGEPGGERINASLDSEFRFAHAYWVAAGVALLWSLREPERRAPLSQGVLAVAAVGGVARAYSRVERADDPGRYSAISSGSSRIRRVGAESSNSATELLDFTKSVNDR